MTVACEVNNFTSYCGFCYTQRMQIIGGVLKSMLTLNEAIIDVKEG
jgi:hypothetical protein